MKPAKFDYERASDISNALELLRQCDGEGKLMAGGQSLGPMMNLRLAQPDLIVDIRRLEELKRIERENGHLFVGAGVTHAAVEDGEVPDVTNGMMQFVAHRIAYRAVRNRGTVGGSVAHCDPAGDWPAALLALGAEAVVRGADGARTVPFSDLFIGPFMTAVGFDEVLEGVRVPALSAQARWAYYKVWRKTGDFAESIGAVVVDPDRDYARIVLGANGSVPTVLDAPTGALKSDGAAFAEKFTAEDASAAIADLGFDFDAVDLQIHSTAVSRAVKEAYKG